MYKYLISFLKNNLSWYFSHIHKQVGLTMDSGTVNTVCCTMLFAVHNHFVTQPHSLFIAFMICALFQVQFPSPDN